MKVNLIFLSLVSSILLFSCNESNNSEKDLLVDGNWIIYDIETNESDKNLGLVLGIWALEKADFESIKFKSDGNYEAFDSEGSSILSEKYRIENNELLFERDDETQALKIKQLDTDNLILESPNGVTTKLKKK